MNTTKPIDTKKEKLMNLENITEKELDIYIQNISKILLYAIQKKYGKKRVNSMKVIQEFTTDNTYINNIVWW